jgi:uncharacterized caspase-like protein
MVRSPLRSRSPRPSGHRDVVSAGRVGRGSGEAGDGRRCIAVIGVDRYRGWNPLRNAVSDARGVLEAFEDLGFERAAEPLLDDAATRDALRCLVTDDLGATLDEDDSLVLFFAGHGHTVTRKFNDGPPMGKGYLFPVDADRRQSTWLDLANWLSDVAYLPPKHILVILDSCYSGVALDCDTRSRGNGPPLDSSSDPLRVRRSRRVITSALDNERAMDSGPVPGHSLFAGCLIEALQGGMSAQTGESVTTGLDLGVYVRNQVRRHASAQQTPDIGTLEGDNRGELFLPLAKPASPSRPLPNGSDDDIRPHKRPQRRIQQRRHTAYEAWDYAETGEPVDRIEGWTLDPSFVVALDRHGAERAHGNHVLSVIAGDALAMQTAWATWAAGHGYLTLVTEGRDLDAAIAELLAQTPWLRCLPAARERLAAAAGLDADAVDAALDARSARERRTWIEDVAALDPHARVSGWLLSSLREAAARIPDLATAPVRGGALLAVACDLACPTAVLVQHAAPDAPWLERAIATAAALTTYLPRHSIAVTAPGELVTRVLHGARPSTALSMARQGLIVMATPAQRSPGRGRHRTARVLFDALARDPRTRGRFTLDGEVEIAADGAAIDVELVAPGARIAVELDGWHHFYDPEGYRRDRIRDMRLQRAGYFVMRFLAEDVDQRLASTLDQIALALAGRRAQGGLS